MSAFPKFAKIGVADNNTKKIICLCIFKTVFFGSGE
jgi:hypothetical protein